MSSSTSCLALLLLAATLAAAHPLTPCSTTCRFTFCAPPSTIDLSHRPDSPATPAICLKSRPIGTANSGEALVRSGRTFVPISQYATSRLAQPFSPHFFKTLSLQKPPYSAAVSHETLQSGQHGILDDTCVALPITHLQLLRNGSVVDNLRLEGSPLVDCVSFSVHDTAPPSVPTSQPLPSSQPSTVPGPSGPSEPSRAPTPEPTKVSEPSRDPNPSVDQLPSLDPLPSADPSVSVEPLNSVTPLPSKEAKPSRDPKPLKTPKPSKETSPKPLPESSAPSVEPTIPSVVGPGDTVEFPSTTELNKATTFNLQVSVSGNSGSQKEDFYLLSDVTNSMGDVIAEVKAKFLDIVSSRQDASSDVAFGLGEYRDERDVSLGVFQNLQPISKNVGQVTEAIEALDTSSTFRNFDSEEASLYALYQVATSDEIGWRDDSRRILVYFGDSPGHEPTCFGGKRVDRDNLIAALKKKSISVVAASFALGSSSPGLDVETTEFDCSSDGDLTSPSGQATAITSETNGKLVESDDQEGLLESILKAVGVLSQELTADVSDCTAQGVDVSFKPELPVVIEAGKTVRLKETVVVKRGVCGKGGSGFTCKVVFSRSNAEGGTQTLSSKSIAEC